MMEFNADLMLGFLIWSALCLVMIGAGRIRENYWKRAARAMEAHADNLKREIAALKWDRYLQRIRHAKKL